MTNKLICGGTRRLVLAALCCGSILSLGGGQAVAQSGTERAYPEPSFPKWLVDPSDERLMQAARLAVRQTGGMAPFGIVRPGTTVHVFLHYSQDMEVWEAIKAAWAELGVNAVAVRGWEAVGMTRDAYERRARENLITGADGWKEYGVFEPAYRAFFPPEIQESFGDPLTVLYRYAEYPDYWDSNTEIKQAFVGSGGGRGFFAMFVGEEHADKYLGSWTYVTKADLLSNVGAFPPDLWKMLDEQIVRPIPHVSEGTFTDPEGTRLHWTLTPEQSASWEKESGLSAYSPGHLNVYPPSTHATWHEGVIVASGNHTAFMDKPMTVRINENGRVTSIEGGGKAGDMFRLLFEHPKFKNASFPSAPEPGYWYLNQDGLGTNPKAVRDLAYMAGGTVEMANLSERHRAGVQHFSFSSAAGTGFNSDPRDIAYAEDLGIPMRHTAHMHVYFGTTRWKLRDTGEWMTVIDKGRLAVFDNPEVRALASRYGDPEVLFRYDWIPAIPGINVPGEYDTYTDGPWNWISSVWKKIKSGSYEYYAEDYDMFADDEST